MMAGKPALLVLTSTYPRRAGDTEPAFVHELCRRLSATFDLRVLAPHAPGAKMRESLDGVDVIRFRYLPDFCETLAYEGGIPAKLRREPWRLLQVPFFLGAQFIAAWRECRRERTDLIHAHWLIPQGLIAAVLKGILSPPPALICTAHGADLYTQRGALARFLKRWTLRRADALTVVSRSMQSPAAVLGAGPMEVASMGADLKSRFVPGTGTRERDWLVFAGRLVEKKGAEHLLEAFGLARARRPALRLSIAGEGPERSRLQERARQLGLADRVEFLGAVPQEALASLFQSSGMAVFPFVAAADGDQEGLGLVVVEAQGCACPVIASDVPAIRDTIVNGETGLLAPPGDTAALAARILSLLEDPVLAGRIASGGRRAAVEKFDWTPVAERYVRILQDALGRSRGA